MANALWRKAAGAGGLRGDGEAALGPDAAVGGRETSISTERQQSPVFYMHANARWVESSGRDLVPAIQMEDAVPGPHGILLLFRHSPI